METAESPLPSYWLPQPPMHLDDSARQACDRLLASALAEGPAHAMIYTLSIPKWQFLCYVAETHQLAVHGSGKQDIAVFEPRQPKDLAEFGAQNAVYAAADGIWPFYFAIVNRVKSPSLVNGCIYLEQADGTLGVPYYLFSISHQAMRRQPFQHGMVYLLPRTTFIRQPPIDFGAWRVHTSQLASPAAVEPLAKLVVSPEDFPFLNQVREHDEARSEEYGYAMLHGLPWPR